MDDLQKAFAALKGRGVSTFAAEVTEVDKENGTCTVKDDDIEYYSVQLSSIIDGSKKQMFIYFQRSLKIIFMKFKILFI